MYNILSNLKYAVVEGGGRGRGSREGVGAQGPSLLLRQTEPQGQEKLIFDARSLSYLRVGMSGPLLT